MALFTIGEEEKIDSVCIKPNECPKCQLLVLL